MWLYLLIKVATHFAERLDKKEQTKYFTVHPLYDSVLNNNSIVFVCNLSPFGLMIMAISSAEPFRLMNTKLPDCTYYEVKLMTILVCVWHVRLQTTCTNLLYACSYQDVLWHTSCILFQWGYVLQMISLFDSHVIVFSFKLFYLKENVWTWHKVRHRHLQIL